MRTEYREEPCKTALNRVRGMGFEWSLNPYMGCAHRCTFCFVRGFEHRADRPFDDRYGTSLRVKTNVMDVLKRELRRPSWRRQMVVIGGATDPYQPAEGRYRLTRGCLQALASSSTPVSLITRGPLIVRDIDVLAEASVRGGVTVNVSVPTLDADIWRRTEPGTAPPRQRLRAVKEMVDAGIKVSVAVAPVLPGLSDSPELLGAVVAAAREAGACDLWCNVLNLRPGTREHFLACLQRDWPELLPRYELLYERPYLPPGEAEPIHRALREMKALYGIEDRRESPLLPAPAEAQLSLFG